MYISINRKCKIYHFEVYRFKPKCSYSHEKRRGLSVKRRIVVTEVS